MTAGQLIVLRHGRTEWNATGRFQGQADIPLDERGLAQAEQAAGVLAELAPAAIVSSDLSAGDADGRSPERADRAAVAVDARLREIHVGSWEGLTIDASWRSTRSSLRATWPVRTSVGRRPGRRSARWPSGLALTLAEIASRPPTAPPWWSSCTGWPPGSASAASSGLPQETWRQLGGLHNCGWITVERHRIGDYWRIADYNVTAPREPAPVSRDAS